MTDAALGMTNQPPRRLIELGVRIGSALDGRMLAVAESFSGGLIVHSLVATAGSGGWLRGGIVAYDSEVKFSVLGVERGPVVNDRTARAMAIGVATLLDAQVGLATTGVAGPEPVEGQPAGTIWVGVSIDSQVLVEHALVSGSPSEVSARGAELALRTLLATLGPRPVRANA
jgi:PncC family amidohydrolase